MTRETEDGRSPEEAGEAERRSGYLGFVAHEVRNPLSTALWSAELLARLSPEERSGARGEKLTAMCLRSLARVRQLVEDHFLCERLDVGGLPVRIEQVPLRPLIEEAAARRPADAGEVQVDVAPTASVALDRALAERALDALLAAAGRDGAAVRVGVRLVEGRATVTVTGAAPAPGALEDPRKGSPGDPKGRSLSLPAARRVARAMGGSLAVEGGVFLLTLPAAPAYTAPPPDTAHP